MPSWTKMWMPYALLGVLVAVLFRPLGTESKREYVEDLFEEEMQADAKPERTHHELYTFDQKIQEEINQQINMELHASLVYLAMGTYFGQDNVHRPGFRKFFLAASDEERDHARKLTDYLNSRNGRLQQFNIEMPPKTQWSSGLEALQDALALEQIVSNSLIKIHTTASHQKHRDLHLADLLESEFFREQVESMRELQGYITTLNNMGTDYQLAEYMFDQELLKKD